MAAFIIALVLVLTTAAGAGTVAASQDALPGDALYGVKTAAEQVRIATALSDESKAKAHLDVAATRVNEMALALEKNNAEAVETAATGFRSALAEGKEKSKNKAGTSTGVQNTSTSAKDGKKASDAGSSAGALSSGVGSASLTPRVNSTLDMPGQSERGVAAKCRALWAALDRGQNHVASNLFRAISNQLAAHDVDLSDLHAVDGCEQVTLTNATFQTITGSSSVSSPTSTGASGAPSSSGPSNAAHGQKPSAPQSQSGRDSEGKQGGQGNSGIAPQGNSDQGAGATRGDPNRGANTAAGEGGRGRSGR